MERHPLAQHARKKDVRREVVVYQGVAHELAGYPVGDAFFAILFPDIEAAITDCAHFASLNNRVLGGKVVAYPLDIYADVLAIRLGYQTPAGTEPLDDSILFALYDNEPALFAQLRAKALIVHGITDLGGTNSGKTAWQGIFATAKALEKLLKGEDFTKDEKALTEVRDFAKAIRQAAKMALKDFNVAEEGEDEGQDDPRDLDQLMEAAVGNSPVAPSPGPV